MVGSARASDGLVRVCGRKRNKMKGAPHPVLWVDGGYTRASGAQSRLSALPLWSPGTESIRITKLRKQGQQMTVLVRYPGKLCDQYGLYIDYITRSTGNYVKAPCKRKVPRQLVLRTMPVTMLDGRQSSPPRPAGCSLQGSSHRRTCSRNKLQRQTAPLTLDVATPFLKVSIKASTALPPGLAFSAPRPPGCGVLPHHPRSVQRHP